MTRSIDGTCENQREPTDSSLVMKRSSRSFSIATRLLPLQLRSHVWGLYAWCRSVDDAVDQAPSAVEATAALQQLEDDLERCRASRPISHDASVWIRPLIEARRIDVLHAKELIEGMRLDIEGFDVKDNADLTRYCYHAAGTVGLMMTQLMGVDNRQADRHAVALGIAMQLTNIARDVREDAEMGRSYLPGIPRVLEADPHEVQRAVADVLALAEEQYNMALRGIRYLPQRCRLPIRVALEVYREIGREIQRNQYSVLHGRTCLGKPRLVFVVMRAVLSALRSDFSEFLCSIQTALYRFLKDLFMHNPSNVNGNTGPSTVLQAKQTAFLGLSLTSIMATALFVLVYINPKSADYTYLPLVYAGCSLLASVLFHRLSCRCSGPTPEQL